MTSISRPEPVALSSNRDEPLFEVVDGQHLELPPLGAYPTEIVARLVGYLAPFAWENDLGKVVPEMLFRINVASGLQRRPDVAFISSARWPRRRPAPQSAAWDLVPDLVIEVVSPTDRAEELMAKIREFFEAGSRVAWLVYPVLRVVHVFDGFGSVRVVLPDGELDGGELLPDFRLPMTTLFDDEPDDESGRQD